MTHTTTATSTELPPPPPVRWGRLIAIIGIVIGIPVGIITCNESRRPYLAWSAQREAWHRKCDAYRQTPLTNPAAAACDEELKALVATAQRHGWQ